MNLAVFRIPDCYDKGITIPGYACSGTAVLNREAPLYGLIRRGLAASKDPRKVVADPQARYYGISVSGTTLIPGGDARLGETRLEGWLSPATMSAR